MRNPYPSMTTSAGARLGTALWASGLLLATLAAPAATPPATAATAAADPVSEVPTVLRGDTWLAHHREDLMPYWDMPEALGTPVGNFPSFRGRAGELLPETTSRGLSTLARGVYGYSLAFWLTGEERYLGYARAGLDWIEAKAKDPEHGGYFGNLTAEGEPVDPTADKDVFDVASLLLAYGMYFNVTRDPVAEAELLAVRDLVFTTYVDQATGRVRDSMTYDLQSEVDTGGNGGDITNLLVPGPAMLPVAEVLSDPARRAQFRSDLRTLVENLIARHKDKTTANGWWFWGRTGRIGNGFYNSLQADYGHNIKSYELIHNVGRTFADRPWSDLSSDRATMLTRAWDPDARRWNEQRRGPAGAIIERDSGWWPHTEADQLLVALNLSDNFSRRDQLAASAQTFLDVYVDRDPRFPARETFTRIERTGTMTDLRKSFRGKNMLHNHEHALLMYLHGRALEGKPARLHYALPADQALTAVARPYWFDSTGQFRRVSRPIPSLPGHRLVEVDFTGLDAVTAPPFPAPEDDTPPTTVATVSPEPSGFGWNRGDATVTLAATDDLVGVKQVRVAVEEAGGARYAWTAPGAEFTVPALTAEGEHTVTYAAVDRLGNVEPPRRLQVRIDRTPPGLGGLPPGDCLLWPPNGRLVSVAEVRGEDIGSGVADLVVSGTANEPSDNDVVIEGGVVRLRAERDPHGSGRVYTVAATVSDRAGNATTAESTCVVPHDRRS